MVDFILASSSAADFHTAAEQLGFTDSEGNVITQANLPDHSGTYFLGPEEVLLVPTGRTITGPGGLEYPELVSDGKVYRGLRINGNNPFAMGLPIPSQLLVIPLVKYNEDGTVDNTYTPPPVGRIS